MGAREKRPELEALFKQGIDVYSISKLDAFNGCQYEYYLTYVKKKKGLNNIYGLLGGVIHDSIEKIYKGEGTSEDGLKAFEDGLIECDLQGVKFSDKNIKDNYVANIQSYFKNFNKINKKLITEKFMLFQVNGIWIQLYIDAVTSDDNKKDLIIYDWKTSSKSEYTNKTKIHEHGRQLLMYKLAIETLTTLKVNKLAWNLIKYCYIEFVQKNGKTKQTLQERKSWVKGIVNYLKRDLRELGTEEFDIEILTNKAVIDNSLCELPQEIQNKYTLKDAFIYYEATEENMDELRNYITNTVNKINNKSKEIEQDWTPTEITPKTNFYCGNLCNHRKHCKYYIEYLENNKESFSKNDKDNKTNEEVGNMFDELFG